MMETMRAVVKAAPGPGLVMAQRPIPTPGPGEVLVKVRAASICGTDLHIYRWDPWAQGRIHPPLIIGHEFCGEVVETGPEVDGIRVGDFISAESHVICGRCDMCRTGKGHLCRNTRILGVDRDGAFVDFIVIPAENAWVNPPDLPLEVAVLLENFGNAVHTAFAVDLRARKVLVTGCGPVGLMTIAVARAIGARMIIATDISPYRLDLARRMGADHVLNPQEVNVVEAIRDLAGGEVDVLLEMSGAPSAIREGFAALKPGGQAALLGLPPGPIEFDLANMVIFKGVTVHGIVGRRLWETWYEIRGLLNSGAVDLRPVVTHRFRLEEFDQAFATMASGLSGKVMLIP